MEHVARQLLFYLHGILSSPGKEEPGHTRTAREFHALLTQQLRQMGKEGLSLAARLQPIVLHWGHRAAGLKPRPDSRLSEAEAFLSARTDLRRHRQRVDRGLPLGATWLLRKKLVTPLRGTIIEGLGDLIYYTSPEGESAIRLTLYEQLFAHLFSRGDKAPNEPISFSIVSHSAGAVIAFDLLFGLFAQPKHLGGGAHPDHALDRVGGKRVASRLRMFRGLAKRGKVRLNSFVTMGSLLPIFFLRRQRLLDQLAKGGLLQAEAIGLKGQGRWLNAWDEDDPAAFPVKGLFRDPENRIQDLQVDTADLIPAAHSNYWRNADLLRAVAVSLVSHR